MPEPDGWGRLYGETVESRELAAALRTLAKERGRSVRALAESVPYSKTTISERLNGRRRPDWEFVELFVTACAGRDLQGLQVLTGRFRALWEAADPSRATLIADDEPAGLAGLAGLSESQAEALVPGQLRTSITAVEDVASTQHRVAGAQLMLSRNHALTTDMLTIQHRLEEAVQALTAERDTLRRERDRLRTQRDDPLREQLSAVQAQLLDTQARLEAAHLLQAATEQRLREAERQRGIAERLRDEAVDQLRDAVAAMAGTDRSTPAIEAPTVAVSAALVPVDDLMGPADRQVGADLLDQLDQHLCTQQADLAAFAAGQRPPSAAFWSEPRGEAAATPESEQPLTSADTNRTGYLARVFGGRGTRSTAVLAALVASVPLALFLLRTDDSEEVRRCLTGVWSMDHATSMGPDHGRTVSYAIKEGRAQVTFNADGSGNVRYSNLRIETAYHGGDPPWAPILDSFDGASRFRYTVNQDRENRTRISYTIIDGTVATESKRGDGVSVRPSLVWLTSSYVACDQTSLTLRVPHEGRADSYVPDR